MHGSVYITDFACCMSFGEMQGVVFHDLHYSRHATPKLVFGLKNSWGKLCNSNSNGESYVTLRIFVMINMCGCTQ